MTLLHSYLFTVTMNTQFHETINAIPYEVVFGVSPSSEPVTELRLIDEQGLSKNFNIITVWLYEFIFTGDLLYYLDDVPSGDNNDGHDNVHVKVESNKINAEEAGPGNTGDAHGNGDDDDENDDDDDHDDHDDDHNCNDCKIPGKVCVGGEDRKL